MQSTGQGGRQSSQPVQRSASTVCINFVAPTIASTGHAATHRVQPMHAASSIRAMANDGEGRARSARVWSRIGVILPPTAARARSARRGGGRTVARRTGVTQNARAMTADRQPETRHSHAPSPVSVRERRALLIALALTASFAVVEVIGGWLAGSLALLSDAGHMVTDVAALSIALFAQRLAQRPPSRRASYGYARAEVLAAFINALIMLAVVVWIAVEAARRLLSPSPVAGVVVIGVAAAGLAVNLVCAWLLSRSSSLNSRAALVHVLGDLAGSVAALVAGAVITATGWLPIDPLLSLFVAVLILRSTWMLL